LPELWGNYIKKGKKTDSAKYNPKKTKLPGSSHLLSVTLEAIETGLSSKPQRNKNLYTTLQRMLKFAGIKLQKKVWGKGRSHIKLTISNDPAVEYLCDHYHLYHEGVETFVPLKDWDLYDAELQEYLGQVEAEVEHMKIQEQVWSTPEEDVDPMVDVGKHAGGMYEELVDEEGLKQLLEDDVPGERDTLVAIMKDLVPSIREPTKRCLRRKCRPKGLWGREWAKYPAMQYTGRRIRAILCKNLY
jgi:hypothetical protein